jgi:succinoglycan biosynthesis protein ExoM
MDSNMPHISVCICTLRRTVLLARLLDKLDHQRTDGRFSYAIVVTDNDPERSARSVVDAFSARARTPATYSAEPRMNIALARNEALRHATGDFVAFIDDDEFPEADWLMMMLDTCDRLQAAGVLGPVRPHFDQPPPHWIVKGGFCERPEHPTGRVMGWEESRTGNVLFRRSIVANASAAFREEFGTGGEDKDFFMRMMKEGHVFRWCNEGIAYEAVPPARWKRSYMLKRALLRGNNILKHPGRQFALLAKSAVAVPIYSLMLPFTLLLGQHVFMKYCIRFCDHAGRLLAVLGLNPVKAR